MRNKKRNLSDVLDNCTLRQADLLTDLMGDVSINKTTKKRIARKFYAKLSEGKPAVRSRTFLWKPALASCLAFIILLSVTVLQSPLTPKESGITFGAPSSNAGRPNQPLNPPDSDMLSVGEAAALFGDNKSTTNGYTKVYVPTAKYLSVQPLPSSDRLPVYCCGKNPKELSKDELQQFTDQILKSLAPSLGAAAPSYTIRLLDQNYEGLASAGSYRFSLLQNGLWNEFGIYSTSEHRQILLDGEPVCIDQRMSDEEIKAKIGTLSQKIFAAFGRSFEDIKIVRKYGDCSEYGADFISIYFYTKSDMPEQEADSAPLTDYIQIAFDNFENYEGDLVSSGVLSAASLYYRQYRAPAAEFMTAGGSYRTLSLAEAEKELRDGHVFGAHNCPLCMVEQEKLDFAHYDYVSFAYVSGADSDCGNNQIQCVPFYIFYKEIGKAPNGNTVYAKTYVCAVPTEGWNDYFESQTAKHNMT